MSPRWLHWPAAVSAPSADVLVVTGPGASGSVNGVTVAAGTKFEFTAGSVAYDTWGIIAFGYQDVGNGYLHLQFIDNASWIAFNAAYPFVGAASPIFRISSTGAFGSDIDVAAAGGFTQYTSDPYGTRYNNCSPSLTSLRDDLSSGSGYTITINNVP